MSEDKKFTPESWDKEIAVVEQVLYQHQAVVVSNQEQYDEAADLIKQANTTINMVEAKRKKYTVPLDEMKKSVMEKKNAIVKPLEEFVEHLKGLRMTWYKSEQARIAAEQKLLEAKALEQAKKEHKSEVQVEILPVPAKTVNTGFSTSTMRKVWKFEVIDKTLVPQEFLMVDEIVVRANIREGVRSIPGIRIYEDISDNVR